MSLASRMYAAGGIELNSLVHNARKFEIPMLRIILGGQINVWLLKNEGEGSGDVASYEL